MRRRADLARQGFEESITNRFDVAIRIQRQNPSCLRKNEKIIFAKLSACVPAPMLPWTMTVSISVFENGNRPCIQRSDRMSKVLIDMGLRQEDRKSATGHAATGLCMISDKHLQLGQPINIAWQGQPGVVKDIDDALHHTPHKRAAVAEMMSRQAKAISRPLAHIGKGKPVMTFFR